MDSVIARKRINAAKAKAAEAMGITLSTHRDPLVREVADWEALAAALAKPTKAKTTRRKAPAKTKPKATD